MEIERMSGEHDRSNCFVSINAGAGGTESQDWADMLLRMLLRYCERKGWKTKSLSFSMVKKLGLKAPRFEWQDFTHFGYLKTENGVHRLFASPPSIVINGGIHALQA